MKPQKTLISFLLLLNLFFPLYSELNSEADYDDNGEIDFRNEVGGQFEKLSRDTDNVWRVYTVKIQHYKSSAIFPIRTPNASKSSGIYSK